MANTPNNPGTGGGKTDIERAAGHENTAPASGETLGGTPRSPASPMQAGSSQTEAMQTGSTQTQSQSDGGGTIRVKEKARHLAEDAGNRARGAADEGKAKAASTLSHLAQSTRDAGRQFEGTEASSFAQYIESAADSIDDFARRLDQKSVDEIVDDLREMVRRSPAIAIGAAAMVGFAISRFAKATERARRGGRYHEDDQFARAASTPEQPRYDA